MIHQFKCECGNTDTTKAVEYDGALGYEAIVCKCCGTYYDHSGIHQKDSWSSQYIENYNTTESVTPEKKVKVVKAVLDVIVGVVKESGSLGAPCISIYMALSKYGVSMENYNAIIQFLIAEKRVIKRHDCLFAA